MSVFMTLKVAGDPKALVQYAKDNPDTMRRIVEAAKGHGLIAHRFYGSEDGGGILILDEWPDRGSFDAFFKDQHSAILPLFEVAGVTEQPDPTFWTQLDTGDAHGWGA